MIDNFGRRFIVNYIKSKKKRGNYIYKNKNKIKR